MGMTDDFETSLQVLRGFETDITVEVNEIKVILPLSMFPSMNDFQKLYLSYCLHICRDLWEHLQNDHLQFGLLISSAGDTISHLWYKR